MAPTLTVRVLALALSALLLATGAAAIALRHEPAAPTPAPGEPASVPAAEAPVAAPPATSTIPPPPLATGVDPALRQRLDEALVSSVGDRHVGAVVTDGSGAVVLSHRAHDLLVPASTIKLVTAAAALLVLDPERRLVTRALAGAPPVGGVLTGDLVVSGERDPALAGPLFAEVRPDRPRTPMEGLADAVVASGVRRVTGRLVVDGSVTVDAGRRVWKDDRGIHSDAAPSPSGQAAGVLAGLLAERGVQVDGGAGTEALAQLPRAVIGQVTSPPLIDLLLHLVQESDNHLADGVFGLMGAEAGDAAPAGAAAAVRNAVAGIGLELGDGVIADGSGLSRANRLSPMFLAQLDHLMSTGPHAERWRRLQAVAGRSGTLERRLVGTPAEVRLRGKTGTLDGVRALTATVEASGRDRWRLVVIGNGLDADGRAAVRRLQDDLGVVLAAEAVSCEQRSGCP